jgi:hypothetical protein
MDYQAFNILRIGNYIEGYRPNIIKSTGLFNPIYDPTIDRPVKYLKYKTGLDYIDKDSIRMITQINNSTKHNIYKNVYSSKTKADVVKRNYLYKGTNITNLNDVFQISANKETVKVYDHLSSRELKFQLNGSSTISDIYCNLYTMQPIETGITNLTENLVSLKGGYNTVYEKFNKPLQINTVPKEYINDTLGNYICVEPYTSFVIASNYSLLVNRL